MQKILVLGIGNILQKDDGLGVHIINSIIESNRDLPEDVEFLDGGTAGYDLLTYMQDREKIVIVDALKVDDKPGSIYRFSPEHLKEEGDTYSLHDVGIQKILKLLTVTGENPEIEIIGIVPEDIETFQIGLSEPVQKAVPGAVEQILDSVVQKV